jgi:hypothetical protein
LVEKRLRLYACMDLQKLAGNNILDH